MFWGKPIINEKKLIVNAFSIFCPFYKKFFFKKWGHSSLSGFFLKKFLRLVLRGALDVKIRPK
jgi:hypothetical protein